MDATGTEDIWTGLKNHAQIKAQEITEDIQKEIVEWVIGQMLTDQDGLGHCVVRIFVRSGGEALSRQIGLFCQQFNQLFFEQKRNLYHGQFFMVFAHEQDGISIVTEKVLKNSLDVQKYNLICTPPIGAVNQNHISVWFMEAKKDIKSSMFQKLEETCFRLPDAPDNNDFEYE